MEALLVYLVLFTAATTTGVAVSVEGERSPGSVERLVASHFLDGLDLSASGGEPVDETAREYMLQLYQAHIDYEDGLSAWSPLRYEDAEVWGLPGNYSAPAARSFLDKRAAGVVYDVTFPMKRHNVESGGRRISDAWLRVPKETDSGCMVEVNPTRGGRLNVRRTAILGGDWMELEVRPSDVSAEVVHFELVLRNCSSGNRSEDGTLMNGRRPLLIVSTTESGEPLSAPTPRATTTTKGRRRQRRSKSSLPADELCQLHKMFISFHMLGWENKILAPKGFEAGVCSGTCPTNGPFIGTVSHSMLVSMMQFVAAPKGIFGSPACVPVGHFGTQLLVYADNSRVPKLKTMKRMRALQCGCR
eukprot:m.18138 g.18138  ORF g.18138 m.18138 type:complete len:359 (+) comp27604_c0_seq1:139-1215(+)